jgi:mono/diheme cytochrome c family protein
MKTKLLAFIGVLAIIGVIVGAGYFLGGFYSVAATEPEPDSVAWALKRTRISSVARHATGTPPTSLDDAATIRAGARAFGERGCANCHGAPGVAWAKWSEGLRPDPPDLKKIVGEREPRELFWVIKHGIKMSGMPAFGPTGVADPEIWSMVAFLKKLPSVSPEDYKAWAGS